MIGEILRPGLETCQLRSDKEDYAQWPCEQPQEVHVVVVCRTCGLMTFGLCMDDAVELCDYLDGEFFRMEDSWGKDGGDTWPIDYVVFCTERSQRHELVALMSMTVL